MTHRQPTVTIGIPAFNEEANIGSLLKDLLKQNQHHFSLEKILIASDGSTDNTVKIIKKTRSPLIILIDNPDRQGPAARQNQIIANTTSEILVLLNADIRIEDPEFISKLIQPIVLKEAELTSPVLTELPPRSYVESVLQVGMKFKTILFETWRDGQNGYLCHGAARAFARRFYTILRFRPSEGEDMFSYLSCLKHHFRFKFIRDASVFYRHPATLSDHLKQSTRFFMYHQRFPLMIPKHLAKQLHIPLPTYFIAGFKALPVMIRYPWQTLFYFLLVCFMKTRVYFHIESGELWQAATTKAV